MKEINYLALGDSYTFGEAVNKAYPQFLAEIWKGHFNLDAKLTVLAKTGWRCDELLAQFKQMTEAEKCTFDLVTILIGVNNFYQGLEVEDFIKDFKDLAFNAIEIFGKPSVAVISIPDYGYTPFGEARQEEIYAGIDLFNSETRKSCELLGVPYYYITDITRKHDPEMVAEDRLHLSEKCHRLIAERLASGLYFQICK